MVDGGAGFLRLLGLRVSRQEDIAVGIALAGIIWLEQLAFFRYGRKRDLPRGLCALHAFISLAVPLALAKIGFHDEQLSNQSLLSDTVIATLVAACVTYLSFAGVEAAKRAEPGEALSS